MKATHDALISMVMTYKPTYFYQMGKEGYECNWCLAMIQPRGDFDKPEEHRAHCAYIQAHQLVSRLGRIVNALMSMSGGKPAEEISQIALRLADGDTDLANAALERMYRTTEDMARDG